VSIVVFPVEIGAFGIWHWPCQWTLRAAYWCGSLLDLGQTLILLPLLPSDQEG
jgi:hypothetical protein